MSTSRVATTTPKTCKRKKNTEPIWQDTCTELVFGLHEFTFEDWKDLQSINGRHRFSTLGRKRNVRTGRILRYGYKGTTLPYPYFNLGGRSYYAHRLVAETSMGCYPSQKVDYISGNSFDCRLSDFRFVTAKQNRRFKNERRHTAINEGRMFESGTSLHTVNPSTCPEGAAIHALPGTYSG